MPSKPRSSKAAKASESGHYHGKVARQQVATGSKSQHEAVVLLTDGGPLKLRRPGGNPFRDPELEKLVGKELDVEGELYAGQLFMSHWTVAKK